MPRHLKKSKHVEFKHQWTQDGLGEGIISLETVGTHHNPSHVLTKFVQAAVFGQHLPIFKPRLSQMFKNSCSDHEKLNAIKNVRVTSTHGVYDVLSKVDHQVCHAQRGQEVSRKAGGSHDSIGQVSASVRSAFTPPPRRGNEHSDSLVDNQLYTTSQ